MAKASYVRLVEYRPPGNYVELHPVYRDAAAFRELIADLAAAVERFRPDVILGVESQGYILAGAAAAALARPFVQIQKWSGRPKLPSHTRRTCDYSKEWKQLGVRKGSLSPGDRCVIVDDWIETGAQIECAMELVARAGGDVVGVVVFHADDGPLARQLEQDGRLIALDRAGD